MSKEIAKKNTQAVLTSKRGDPFETKEETGTVNGSEHTLYVNTIPNIKQQIEKIVIHFCSGKRLMCLKYKEIKF